MNEPFDPGLAWWELLLISLITVVCLLLASWSVYALVLVPDTPCIGATWPLPPDATLHDLAWTALALTAFIWVKEVHRVFAIHHARVTQGGLLPRRRASP